MATAGHVLNKNGISGSIWTRWRIDTYFAGEISFATKDPVLLVIIYNLIGTSEIVWILRERGVKFY